MAKNVKTKTEIENRLNITISDNQFLFYQKFGYIITNQELTHSTETAPMKTFIHEGCSGYSCDYPVDDAEVILYNSLSMYNWTEEKKLLIAFIEWYREDDMSKFSPEHLADWFLKIK